MDIKSKKRIRSFIEICICIFLALGIVYVVSLFRVSDSNLNYISKLDAKFEDSEYYEAIIGEELQQWVVNNNLCDDNDSSITDYKVGKVNLSIKMIMRYQPINKKVERVELTNTDQNKPFSQQVKAKKTFRILLNRNIKINKDGSIAGKTDGRKKGERVIKESDPIDYYSLYSEGGFYLTLPESFYVNDSQQTRVESGVILVGLSPKLYKSYHEKYVDYISNRKNLAKKLSIVIIGEMMGILGLVLLFTSEKQMPTKIKRTNHIWNEIMILLILLMFFLGMSGSLVAVNAITTIDQSEVSLVYTVTGVCAFLCICILATCLRDMIWRMKQGIVFESTFVAKSVNHVVRGKRRREKLEAQGMKFYEEQVKRKKRNFTMIQKYILVIVICAIALVFIHLGSAHPILVIVIIICMGLVVNRLITKQYEFEMEEAIESIQLVEQIDEIAEGNFDYNAQLDETSVYYPASKRLENIGSGLEQALEKQMKDERMKIDLITNVSHDLKTPLTSMVGYTDLLMKDDSLSQEAKDYVQILSNKTEHLQQLILDLFELAKATSGDVKVDFAKMSMKRLVEQVVIEMENQIEKSQCSLVYEDVSENNMFLGDVNRMYRVVQNVIENALKYSLVGTRIFIQIKNVGKDIVLEVKNTASYEMNFTKEEIMERFARGDKTRSSEGTGLGLSIADSFTKNCNGTMDVEIDGDQFKVIISFCALLEEQDMV